MEKETHGHTEIQKQMDIGTPERYRDSDRKIESQTDTVRQEQIFRDRGKQKDRDGKTKTESDKDRQTERETEVDKDTCRQR